MSNMASNAKSTDEACEKIKNCIKTFPDFPKKGVFFRDILPIFQNPPILKSLFHVLAEHYKAKFPEIHGIVGLEARGFLLGPPLSLQLGIPFIPVRKAGKLPGEVFSVSYGLEYGKATFELQHDSISKGQKVVIIDDLLATGGSLQAAINLVQLAGGEVLECSVIVELVDLGGQKNLTAPFFSLLQF